MNTMVAPMPGKSKRKVDLIAYLFILPALGFYLIFNLLPALGTFFLSFVKWNLLIPTSQFIGLKNYREIFADPLFWNALKHNGIYLVLSMTVPVAIALVLAIILAEITRGRSRTFFRALLFLPAIFSGVVVAYVWAWIFHPFVGVINKFLDLIHLGILKQSWLGDSRIALYSIFIAHVWAVFGYSMVILLAGIQNIPSELYDAARVDGVNFIQKHRFVTIPLLHDVLTFVWSLRIMAAMGMFDIVFTLTKGGPYYATDVIETYIYRMIANYEMGWATAAANVQSFLVLAMVWFFILRREYE